MITVNNETLRTFLAQQDAIAIQKEFNRAKSCHSVYHAGQTSFTPRKPRPSKPIITTKEQVFYYYLTSEQKLARKYYSFTKLKQKAIKNAFNSLSINSSKQAIAILTSLTS